MPDTHVRSSESHNTRLVGSNDLQGRKTLQITLRGDWCYAAHLPGIRFNPLTGKDEDNGTTIVDVSDPRNPRLVSHIPASPGANCRSVQVAEIGGEVYLIRNDDYLVGDRETKECSFQIYNVTDRHHPVYVSSITDTPVGLLTYAHKGWWDEQSGLYFASAGEQGFRPGGHMVIWDVSNPRLPTYVSSHWLPGQKLSEFDPSGKGPTLHHPVVDMENKRVYMGYPRGGYVAVVDISDIYRPNTILNFCIDPPFNKGPHTALPFYGVKCPNFAPGVGDIRDFIVFVNEANNNKPNCREVRTMIYMLDVTAWKNPMTVDTFRVPDGDFCSRGGRFGPHQFAETRDGKLYSLKDNNYRLWVAYFNAGLRVLDLSDPYCMKEVGHYIPETAGTVKPRPQVIQANDVDIDYRGLAYLSDRAGNGMYIIEYMAG